MGGGSGGIDRSSRVCILEDLWSELVMNLGVERPPWGVLGCEDRGLEDMRWRPRLIEHEHDDTTTLSLLSTPVPFLSINVCNSSASKGGRNARPPFVMYCTIKVERRNVHEVSQLPSRQ